MSVAREISSKSVVPAVAVDVACTLGAVAVLVILGKLIGTLGQGMHLKDSCWQLLSLRAAAGAICVSGLVAAKRDRMWVFGVAYGLVLLAGHGNAWAMSGAVGAGVVVSVLRNFGVGPVVSAVVYVGVMALPGAVNRTSSKGSGASEIVWDFAVRLGVGFVAALGVVLVTSCWNRHSDRSASKLGDD